MKTARCLGLVALLALPLFADWPATNPLKPVFVPDELIVVLDGPLEDPSQPMLIFADLCEATGVEQKSSFGFGLGSLVRLKPGVKFGQAFRAILAFQFTDFPGWSLRYVEPNHISLIPELPPAVRRVFNFSSRAEVGAGYSVAIGGIVVPGEFPRVVVFKVRGASLADFNVAGTLSDPRVTLFDGDTPVLSNDDWTTLSGWEKFLGSFLCPPPDDERESMLVTYLDPGAYTAIVSGADGGTGIVLLEMYLEDTFYVQ